MSTNDLSAMERAAHLAQEYRSSRQPLHSGASLAELRVAFDAGLPDEGRPAVEVIEHLVRAATPGLVGNTQPCFHGWVMGSSHPAGVAADWLTSAWGQNAAIHYTSPAAAVAEETAARWLLDLLDLPPAAAVGFTSGATMAGFIGLAAARGEVLRRAGCDLTQAGLKGAPEVKIFISAEAHESNFAALRYLGFGEADLVRIPVDSEGVMDVAALATALAPRGTGSAAAPSIIVSQAGHINSGAFDRFEAIADLAERARAWLHVDGAFGLWARASQTRKSLAAGVDRADSWGIDGHKWLQLPYENGFAIVRDAGALRRAMDISASYLDGAESGGRNPTHYGPELSRRARGFAVWTVLQTLGRKGVAAMVDNHCRAARRLADRLAAVPCVRVENAVALNQVALSFGTRDDDGPERDRATKEVCDLLNRTGMFFLGTATWRAKTILRVSVIGAGADEAALDGLAETIGSICRSYFGPKTSELLSAAP
jgi:glutamate/tyrosine decarboxylase-like PLP-dependent enzyme